MSEDNMNGSIAQQTLAGDRNHTAISFASLFDNNNQI